MISTNIPKNSVLINNNHIGQNITKIYFDTNNTNWINELLSSPVSKNIEYITFDDNTILAASYIKEIGMITFQYIHPNEGTLDQFYMHIGGEGSWEGNYVNLYNGKKIKSINITEFIYIENDLTLLPSDSSLVSAINQNKSIYNTINTQKVILSNILKSKGIAVLNTDNLNDLVSKVDLIK